MVTDRIKELRQGLPGERQIEAFCVSGKVSSAQSLDDQYTIHVIRDPPATVLFQGDLRYWDNEQFLHVIHSFQHINAYSFQEWSPDRPFHAALLELEYDGQMVPFSACSQKAPRVSVFGGKTYLSY